LAHTLALHELVCAASNYRGLKIMAITTQNRLLRFLKDELLLPNDSIDLALRQCNQRSGSLPIILWQYGLITLDQLSSIYDWLETV
jgi:hypothetical protein